MVDVKCRECNTDLVRNCKSTPKGFACDDCKQLGANRRNEKNKQKMRERRS